MWCASSSLLLLLSLLSPTGLWACLDEKNKQSLLKPAVAWSPHCFGVVSLFSRTATESAIQASRVACADWCVAFQLKRFMSVFVPVRFSVGAFVSGFVPTPDVSENCRKNGTVAYTATYCSTSLLLATLHLIFTVYRHHRQKAQRTGNQQYGRARALFLKCCLSHVDARATPRPGHQSKKTKPSTFATTHQGMPFFHSTALPSAVHQKRYRKKPERVARFQDAAVFNSRACSYIVQKRRRLPAVLTVCTTPNVTHACPPHRNRQP